MVQRVIKVRESGWHCWAIGAALSVACAAFFLVRRRRSASRAAADDYEAWWQHREEVRANGDRAHNSPQLFV